MNIETPDQEAPDKTSVKGTLTRNQPLPEAGICFYTHPDILSLINVDLFVNMVKMIHEYNPKIPLMCMLHSTDHLVALDLIDLGISIQVITFEQFKQIDHEPYITVFRSP